MPSFIISFVFILLVCFKISYPNTTVNLKTKFNALSGMIISEILMNIMSCHGFSKYPMSNVILTCRSYLVSCYINKYFVVVETEKFGQDNIPIMVKEKINAINLYKKEIILTCKAATTSVFNTLNKIDIPRYHYGTYVSNYYNDRHVE